MFTISAFADEISPDPQKQVDVLKSCGVRHIEFRSIHGTNVLALSDDELARVAAALAARGVGVSSIGSPIGKIGIADDFAPHLEDFKRALHAAHTLDAPFIRIFSFFMPEGGDPARYRGEVLDLDGREIVASNGRLHSAVTRLTGEHG